MRINLKSTIKMLGLGKVALHTWHRPVGLLRTSILEGGPLEQHRTERGRREMVQAAQELAPLTPPLVHTAASINFLSGRKYWYQTLFCFVSLQKFLPYRVTPIVHDDGSLDAEIKGYIQRVVPWVEFVEIREIERRLDADLPVKHFPNLRARRLVYPHLRKFTDIHIGQSDWGLVFDSDMLFFHKPDELIDWLESPKSIFMMDIDTAYGYSDKFMRELSGGPVLPLVNVGLYGLNRAEIDWHKVEHWCSEQLSKEGPSYFQEQSLTALELTSQNAMPLSPNRYRLMPDLNEGSNPTAIMHHYVGQSKRSYFQAGWRLVK